MPNDLKTALMEKDVHAMERFVVDQQNYLLDEWINQPHQKFYATLQRSIQSSYRLQQRIFAEKDKISYQLGVWDGWLQAFRALYNEEAKERDILEMAISKSPKTAKIIRFLYRFGQPICHGDLADRLGMSYSALTNAMKRAIGCGAVSASRTGRNTRYTLTSAAKQYCERETVWETTLSDSIRQTTKELMRLLELQENSDSQSACKKLEDRHIHVGDSVTIYANSGEQLFRKNRLTRITEFGPEKIIELEPLESNNSLSDVSSDPCLLNMA